MSRNTVFKEQQDDLNARYVAGQRVIAWNSPKAGRWDVGANRRKLAERSARKALRAIQVAEHAVARAGGEQVGRAPKLKRYGVKA